MLKKLFWLFLILISFQLSVSAHERVKLFLEPNESYLILLNKPAEKIMASNENAIKGEILTTIYNEKTQIILNTILEGFYRLYIGAGKDVAILHLHISEQNSNNDIDTHSKIVKNIMKIDRVQSTKKNLETQNLPFEIDEPPMLKGGQ